MNDDITRPYGACTITGPSEDVSFIFRHLPDVDDAPDTGEGPDCEDGPDEEGFTGPRPWNNYFESASVDLDVRRILLEVVPGPDGMGEEIYAKTTEDVVNKLNRLDEQLEALQAWRGKLVAIVEARRSADFILTADAKLACDLVDAIFSE